MGGQGAQVGAFAGFYDLIGKGDGDGAVGLLFVGLVGAAAVVAVTADTKVVVAGDGGDASFADLVDDFVGPDVVTDEVAEAVDGVWSSTSLKKDSRAGRLAWMSENRAIFML